jgi:molecular chaperone GrpE
MPEIDPALKPAAVAENSIDSDASEVTSSAQADDPGIDVIAGSVEHGLATETSAASDEPSEDFDGAAAPAHDVAMVVDAIQGLGDRLNHRLDSLQTTFDRELRAEATRERVIDRLHAELQEYKQDFLLKVQRPIFVDLVQLHDDIAKMIDSKSASEGDLERITQFRSVFESIQTAIEDILYRQGVEPFVVEGSAFDPRKQRAVSTVSTDDASLNKTVAGRLRKGFAAADKVIRPEIVTVYTWRPSPPASQG